MTGRIPSPAVAGRTTRPSQAVSPNPAPAPITGNAARAIAPEAPASVAPASSAATSVASTRAGTVRTVGGAGSSALHRMVRAMAACAGAHPMGSCARITLNVAAAAALRAGFAGAPGPELLVPPPATVVTSSMTSVNLAAASMGQEPVARITNASPVSAPTVAASAVPIRAARAPGRRSAAMTTGLAASMDSARRRVPLGKRRGGTIGGGGDRTRPALAHGEQEARPRSRFLERRWAHGAEP